MRLALSEVEASIFSDSMPMSVLAFQETYWTVCGAKFVFV